MVRKLYIQQLLTLRREERPPPQMPKAPNLEDNYPVVAAARHSTLKQDCNNIAKPSTVLSNFAFYF
ncbi:hypothetical protein A2U01_0026430, partial [Trifolium medium]|nr:hypothetical protein [Trifolium medium]